MADEQPAAERRGVAIVANDGVIDWLLPFLESYVSTNAATPLYLIPFDDRTSRTRRAADRYGAIWVKDDLAELDELARRLYPLFPHHRRRLRKLQALALPLDNVIYIDVDTILFRNLDRVFDAFLSGESEFVIASSSEDYVYNAKRGDHAFLDGVKLFNDGFFLTSRKIISLGDFRRVVEADEKLFHSVRKRGMLFAQPLVNFVVHRLGLKVRSLSECDSDASDESFYKAEGVKMQDGGPVDWQGRAIYFAHWAGAIAKPRRRVFDPAWLALAARARERMEAKISPMSAEP
ncbi:MAG TPA: hypothetical protein VGF97_13910 [Rhizomicrobium sp.]|jgi:hypothetical protein